MQVNKQKMLGVLNRITIYVLLSAIGFVFIYPIILLLSTSGKDLYGLFDPRVRWVPTRFEFSNYTRGLDYLGGFKTLWITIAVMGSVAITQTASSAVIAYGFAKGNFWGKRILFGLMIATFFVPQQVSFLPKYVLYNNLNWMGTVWPVLIPSLLGQGLKNTIFILMFYQFFMLAPPSLDEAAKLDGAGNIRIFLSINLKMAGPAAITSFILSLVWNWNEIAFTGTYFAGKIVTLPLALWNIKNFNWMMYQDDASTVLESAFHRGIESASVIMSMIPLILLYIIFERRLIESIDMTGITGE